VHWSHFFRIRQVTECGLTVGYGVQSSRHCGGLKEIRTLRVVETKLKIKVRWQDGSETEEDPLNLVPYQNIDE
jgi:hypothetical protein